MESNNTKRILIQAGAKLIMNPGDILEEYNLTCKSNKKQHFHLDNDERLVYDCMCLVPKDVDDLVFETELSPSRVMGALMRLETMGAVRPYGKSRFVVRL